MKQVSLFDVGLLDLIKALFFGKKLSFGFGPARSDTLPRGAVQSPETDDDHEAFERWQRDQKEHWDETSFWMSMPARKPYANTEPFRVPEDDWRSHDDR